MNVKRYEADTIQEALSRVKIDLGPEATILFVREVKKSSPFRLSAKRSFEVIAGGPERHNSAIESTKLEMIQYELRQMKDFIKDVVQHSNAGAGQPLYPQPLREVFESLTACDIDESIAHQLLDTVKQRLSEKDLQDSATVTDALIRQIAAIIDVGGPITAGTPKIIAFVGPTGVGKTTTVAKLAANYTLVEKKKVALVTIDTYRIAAVEQLKTYAEIMGISIDVVFTPKELLPALQKHKDKDIIFIDTAGRNPLNDVQMDELRNFLGQEASIEVQLLISVTTKSNEMSQIFKRFELAKVHRLILTKLDEASTFGSLLSAAVHSRRPISYITTGQDVPEDIELADSMRLAKLVVAKENPFINRKAQMARK